MQRLGNKSAAGLHFPRLAEKRWKRDTRKHADCVAALARLRIRPHDYASLRRWTAAAVGRHAVYGTAVPNIARKGQAALRLSRQVDTRHTD
jgi:hypothetical protein